MQSRCEASDSTPPSQIASQISAGRMPRYTTRRYTTSISYTDTTNSAGSPWRLELCYLVHNMALPTVPSCRVQHLSSTSTTAPKIRHPTAALMYIHTQALPPIWQMADLPSALFRLSVKPHLPPFSPPGLGLATTGVRLNHPPSLSIP